MESIDYYKLYKKYKLKYKTCVRDGGGFGIDSMGEDIGESVGDNASDQGVDQENEVLEQDSFDNKDLDKKKQSLQDRQKQLSRSLDTQEIMNRIFSEYSKLNTDPKIALVSSIRNIFDVKKNPAFNPQDIIHITLDSRQWNHLEKMFQQIKKPKSYVKITNKLNPEKIYELLSKICIFSYADSISSYFKHLSPESDRSCITGSNKTIIYSKILLCVMQHQSKLHSRNSDDETTKNKKSKEKHDCHYSKKLEINLPKNIKAQNNPDKKYILKQENIPELLYNSVSSLKKLAEIDFILGEFLDMTQAKSNSILTYWLNILKISQVKLKNIKNVYKIKINQDMTNSDQKRKKIIYEDIIQKIQDYIEAINKFISDLEKIDINYLEQYVAKLSKWTPKKNYRDFFPPMIKIDPVVFSVPEMFRKNKYYSLVLQKNITIPKEIINIWAPLSH